VVQLQTQLKQAAMSLIKQIDSTLTARVDEIGAARRAINEDLCATRRMIDAARTNMEVDGMNNAVLLESISSSLASTPASR